MSASSCRIFRQLVGLAACLALPVTAAEQVIFGPEPGWATPVAPLDDDAGLILRLADVQTRIEADGRMISRVRQIMRITTPETAMAFGNVMVNWQPATDRVIVHRVMVRRGGEALDVLGDGSGFTLMRREAALERAILDGRLTAVMQVKDLRVGDELEVSFSHESLNPVLQGAVEGESLLANPVTLGRAWVSTSWPSTMPVRQRDGQAMPKSVVSRAGGRTTSLMDVRQLKPIPLPSGAPGRYYAINRSEFTSFENWNAISRLMAPLYDEAAILPADSAVRAEIARIAAAHSTSAARAAAALQLVQRDVRYLARVDGLGGLVPVAADAVWKERLGDCKGKTALLLALLKGLGIDARAALVSVQRSDGVDQSLPMAGRFDHVLVEARIDGKSYWLDGTRRGDNDLASIPVPGHQWALPLSGEGETLVALTPTALAEPQSEWRLDLDATAGLDKPAKAIGQADIRGDEARDLAGMLAVMDPDTKERWARNLWLGRHDWVTVESVSTRIDETSGTVRLGFAGTAEMDWDENADGKVRRYEANKARLGQSLWQRREPGPASDAPILVAAEYRTTRQTILLPEGSFTLDGAAPIDETIGGIRYRRTASLAGNRFDMAASTFNNRTEISLADAKAADTKTDALFNRRLFIRAGSETTAAAGQGEPPITDWNEAGRRAQEALQQGKPEMALAIIETILKDYPFEAMEQQLMLPPRASALLSLNRNAEVLRLTDNWRALPNRFKPMDNGVRMMRAHALSALDLRSEALAELDAALVATPKDAALIQMRDQLLLEDGKSGSALDSLDRRIRAEPDNPALLQERAAAYEKLSRNEEALADYRTLYKLQPDFDGAPLGIIRTLNRLARREEALTVLQEWESGGTENPVMLAVKANLLANMGRYEEAQAAADRAYAIEPTANILRVRLNSGLSGSPEAMLDDAVRLLAIEPGLIWPGHMVRAMPRTSAAANRLHAALDDAFRANPALKEAIASNRAKVAILEGKVGPEVEQADRLAATRGEKREAVAAHLNTACFGRAELGMELEKALAQCTRSLAYLDSPAARESRGLVHIRLGRWDAAVADYDAALKAAPDMSAALYGRGLARLEKGDPGGETDLAAARRQSPMVDRTFRLMGLTPVKTVSLPPRPPEAAAPLP